MPKYKPTYEDQTVFIHLSAANQFQVKSFEFAIYHLLENDINTSLFESNWKNHTLGAPAYHPKIMLKVILMAYSMGITSSRTISQLCTDNTTFMILSGHSFPKKSKIAAFISSHPAEIESIFLQVLSVCYKEKLIGNQMFAIDGCKMPSNASKEWSGTMEEFSKKKKKLEKAIRYMIQKHQSDDTKNKAPDRYQAEQKQIAKLKGVNRKIKLFLRSNRDKPGKRKKAVKSNITDNESAKMKCAKGVIQGVNAVTVADAKHQIILGMQVFDSVDERSSLKPLIEQVRQRLQQFFPNQEILKKVQFLADSGFCSEANLRYLIEEEINSYIADRHFRKRDPRFKDALKNHSDRLKSQNRYSLDDFYFDPKINRCVCPMGNLLWLKSPMPWPKDFQPSDFRHMSKIVNLVESVKNV